MELEAELGRLRVFSRGGWNGLGFRTSGGLVGDAHGDGGDDDPPLSPSLLVNGAFKFKIILMMSSLPSGLQWNHCHRLIGKQLPKIFNFGHLWNLYQDLGANVNSRMHGISKPHKYK